MIILEKDLRMIETRRLENVVIFIETILSFVLSRKIINLSFVIYKITNITNVYVLPSQLHEKKF